jgi:metal transporter CNNM
MLMLIISSLIQNGRSGLLLFLSEVFLLVVASAICSGLNISVMSLDIGDLRRKAKLGSKQAKRVLPLRSRAHLTLASILLTNVAAVSATTLVLHQRLSGWVSGALATFLIVIFGEVMPQALFSRRALSLSSFFAPVLKFMIAITYVLSRPLEFLLNRLFPHEEAKLQTRHELGLVMSEHERDSSSELDDNEIEIMRGALGLSEKRARDIMTDIRHTYWLTPDTRLNEAKIDEVVGMGYSRIPIFDPELTKCYGVLLMKDLVDVDFSGGDIRVDDMALYPAHLTGSMTALDTLFRKFINAGSHLMPLEKDDKIVGIVTIEDLIEEIVGHEIEDETDRFKRLSGDEQS